MQHSNWYYTINGQQQGPVETSTLQQMVAAGQVDPGESVWREGMADWVRVGDAPELGPYVPQPGGFAAQSSTHPYTPGYGQPGGYANADTGGKATAALVLGILSLLFCWCPLIGYAVSIPAWVLGAGARQGVNPGPATAGMILGIIGTVLTTLVMLGWLLRGIALA